MNATVTRVGAAFRLGPRASWFVAVLVFIGLTAVVALATRRDMLPMALAAVAGGIIAAISLRWPIVALAVFAALIPIEQVILIDGVGTISRLAGLLFAGTYALLRIGRLNFGVMPPLGWAFLGWAIVSVGWALDADTAWTQLATLIQMFVIALLIADFVVYRPDIVRPILWVYSLSATAIALIGILSYAGTDARAAALEDQNPAQFAAVLLPALAFGLYEALNGARRVPGSVVALVTTLGVLVSGTRGAWVAVVVIVLLFVLPQLDARRRIAAGILAAVMVGIVLQIPGLTELVEGRIETALSTGGAGRTDIWSVGATIYQSAPILGVGYANFPVAYTSEVVLATSGSAPLSAGRAPHNIVVGTVVELGPIGLGLLAMFLLPLAIRRGWGPDAGSVQAAIAGLLSLALFLDIVGNRKQVWLFAGIAIGLAYLAQRRRADRPGATATPSEAGPAPIGVRADPPPVPPSRG